MPKAASESPSKASSALPTSAFSFTAPFPSTSTATATAGSLQKQRRVSLALPSSPRQVPAWTFRDDTGIERRGKMRKLSTTDAPVASSTEKKVRKKWTMEETQMLVEGCNRHGVGNWKSILNDPSLQFDHRSPVDLKDRFRTYFPDAYKQHYPNAKTHLSSKIRSALPDGSSIFEKTRSKKRRPFTEEEDRALKAGYDKHGTVWAAIVKDPIFQEQNRRSTDLRDRFRNAFPELYKAAGYKPRATAKKTKTGATVVAAPQMPMRAATDEQLTAISDAGPARRKRRHTTQGLLRGGTKSVPQSASCSEEEDTSADEEDDEQLVSAQPFFDSQAMPPPPPPMADIEVDMQHIDDALADPLSVSDFLPAESSQAWSSATTSTSNATWSNSPSSSTQDLLFSPSSSPFSLPIPRQPHTMIGKSAWGPTDWLSANPRLDSTASPSAAGMSLASSSSPSYFSGLSPSPSSPFSLSQLSQGVLDRYDLFPSARDFASASEAGLGDTHSAFSDPDMFSSAAAFRGFTHHSNYAGDLIFGARTHQPQHPQGADYGPGFGFGSAGLGLSGMSMMHASALPGIDEIELTAINLNDEPDAMDTSGGPDGGPKPSLAMDDFTADGLTQETELVDTPPGTPVHSGRPKSLGGMHSLHAHAQAHSMHNRSLSVPPPEHRFAHALHASSSDFTSQAHSPLPNHTQGHAQQPLHAPLTPTRSLSLDLNTLGPESALHALLQGADPWRAIAPGDCNEVPFLDLHYYGSPAGGAAEDGGFSAEEARQGLALDLAGPGMGTVAPKALALPTSVAAGHGQYIPRFAQGGMPEQAMSSTATIAPQKLHLHHRGMSAVSPQDLMLRKGGDNKRKRASWDGGPR